ncbi:MAG TPA: QacE family quaternary ammonium compound efflux SMR transporter [Pseudomonas sp.]|nr:QacE family quaternary ammonium compound efflux SMR transporter [Pseudomonas sp.]
MAETTSSWLLLIVAGFLEIAFAVGLKSANGMERPWYYRPRREARFGIAATPSLLQPHRSFWHERAVWTGVTCGSSWQSRAVARWEGPPRR